MYNIQYQYTHDIDWFFLIGNIPIHCASNGGRVPNIYRAVELQGLQVAVESIKPSRHYVINRASVEQHISQHYRNMDEGIFVELCENGTARVYVFRPRCGNRAVFPRR